MINEGLRVNRALTELNMECDRKKKGQGNKI